MRIRYDDGFVAYLNGHDALQAQVQDNALRGIFNHMAYRFEPRLGEKGWIIGGDLTRHEVVAAALRDALEERW